MAPLIHEARRVRAEAADARTTALALRVDVVRTRRVTRARSAAAAAAAAAANRRPLSVPSPWSTLRWERPERGLERVLEPV